MKRVFIKLIIFFLFSNFLYFVFVIIIAIFLDVGITRNLRYKLGAYGFMNTRVKEIRDYGTVDYLIIGASDAYRGFDPRIFASRGIRIFNAGSSSQSPIQSEIVLRDCLEHLKPKRIIYAVSHYTLTSDGVESAVDLISNRDVDIRVALMAFRTQNIKAVNTFFYALFRQLFGLNENYSETLETDEDLYVSGGYVEKKTLTFNHNSKMELLGTKNSINLTQEAALERILLMAGANGIEVIFVKTPVAHYDEYCSLYSSIWLETKSWYKSRGKFMDINSPLMAFTDSLHFYDQYHLNQNGVFKFNMMLIDSLR